MDGGTTTNLKLVVVGDGMVGKTCLLLQYTKEEFPHEVEPTIYDVYSKIIVLEKQRINMSMWDTAGQDEYAEIRPLSYEKVDAFLIAFAVDNRHSFDHIKNKWYTELKENAADIPIVLVGTKTDKRAGSASGSTSFQEGVSMAKQIGAVEYLECAAITNEGVREVFEKTARICLKLDKPKCCGCSIL